MRSTVAYYAQALMSAGAGCALGCSGRGDCMNGTCLCEIRYAGDECDGPNMPYHTCIGGVFLLVAGVCAVQLLVCIATEYRRQKSPSLLRACEVTTQKMLYLLAFLAALIRGAYFISPAAFREGWATSLLSAYYPLLMSGSSLVVCFWAEVFHLHDIRWERPRFLSKSFLAFATFNLISYSLLAAEVLTTNVADTSPEKKSFYQHVFNGCYAVLLFIVVIFFLIYGVEVYFKVRGGFLRETKVCTVVSVRPPASARASARASRADPDDDDDEDGARDTLVTKQGIQTDLSEGRGVLDSRSVNHSQLHQSRFGLISQALMLIIIAGFLASETLSEFWKAKVPVVSRNWHDLVFRLAEIGVALWFPCVLWNSMAPERLWLLNPRRLLARQLDDSRLGDLLQQATNRKWLTLHPVPWYKIGWCLIRTFRMIEFVLHTLRNTAVFYFVKAKILAWPGSNRGLIMSYGAAELKNVETDSLVGSLGAGAGPQRDCWICYDSERAEPLIRPCRCTGDVSSVHHDCLRRWLVESAASADGLRCKVCNSPYEVQETTRVSWEQGLTAAHWARSALAVAGMCGAGAAAWLAVQLFASTVVRVLAAGSALLICYLALRTLGMSTVTAYQRAKVSSLHIMSEPAGAPGPDLPTISNTVTVDMASKAALERALKGEIEK